MPLNQAPSPYQRFAVVPVGVHDKPPDNAVIHGSWPEIMEHVPDSRVIRQKIKILNDAAMVESRLNEKREALRHREDAVSAREDAVAADHAGFNHDLADEILRRITDLEVRFAQLEAKRNHDPDDDLLPSPPGDPGPLPLHERSPPPGTPDIAAMLPASDDAGDDPHIPGGELHDLPAKDSRGQFLRLKHPVSFDEEEFPDPKLPTPPVIAQPIAAGLDEE
jgi:hypothetical protein